MKDPFFSKVVELQKNITELHRPLSLKYIPLIMTHPQLEVVDGRVRPVEKRDSFTFSYQEVCDLRGLTIQEIKEIEGLIKQGVEGLIESSEFSDFLGFLEQQLSNPVTSEFSNSRQHELFIQHLDKSINQELCLINASGVIKKYYLSRFEQLSNLINEYGNPLRFNQEMIYFTSSNSTKSEVKAFRRDTKFPKSHWSNEYLFDYVLFHESIHQRQRRAVLEESVTEALTILSFYELKNDKHLAKNFIRKIYQSHVRECLEYLNNENFSQAFLPSQYLLLTHELINHLEEDTFRREQIRKLLTEPDYLLNEVCSC